VPGGLAADLRAAVDEAFTGQDTGFISVGNAFVLPEEVSDLSSADATVPCRHVGVFTEVPVQLSHERLTEAHDFALGAPFRVEVRAAFTAPDGHSDRKSTRLNSSHVKI